MVDAATFWDQLASALGLPRDTASEAFSTSLRAVIVALVAIWLGGWVRARIQLLAKTNYALAGVASLVSRAAGLVVYLIGATIVLGIMGVNPTALTTVLAAATIGSTLAMQDVARGFVNGVYVLVERPYRVGDRLRIGATEGQVEEVGVVLTRLRTDRGELAIVPNSLILSNVVAKTAEGLVYRRRYTVTGIDRPATEIAGAIQQALKGAPHLSHRAVVIDLLSAGPEGASVAVSVEHEPGHRVDGLVMTRLREAFPEATVTTTAAANAP